ncbi:MAG: Hsp20/alpha crystallin family protein [Planctomycetota bacterium]
MTETKSENGTTTVAEATETPARRRVLPRATSRATDAGMEIQIELPGASRESIELSVEDGELLLAATTSLTAPKAGRARHVEFRPADFAGRWSLPEDVTAEGAASTFEHGVLRLDLPRRAKSKQTIEIG